MNRTLNLSYTPGGPVLGRFMSSRAPVQAIMGPIGSGKTQGAAMKIVRVASAQARSTVDGIRKVKACVVRDTYRQLWKTTIPSWWKRVPKELGEWVGSDGDPASHHIFFKLPDGSTVDLLVDFVAIGENAVEDVLRGYEPTMFYLNEMDLLDESVFIYARSRVGRYPEMAEGGPSWYGIIGDLNAPDTESWVYRQFVEELPEGWAFFQQPGGRDPGAENLRNLPPGYYEAQISGQPAWWVRRMIDNKFGFSRDGKPVFEEFNDLFHVSPTKLNPVNGLPLMIGLDAGLSPAGTIGQRMPNGQWRITDELVTEQGTGANRFGDRLAQLLAERYNGFSNIRAWADPSAAYGADKQAGEENWIEIVAHAAGIRIDAAPTNALIPRLEAVRLPLTRLIDGLPGFLLSPHCGVLRKGLNAMYRYRRLKVPGSSRFSDEPEKNAWSHPLDALQYQMCGGGEYVAVMNRGEARRLAARQTMAVDNWDPMA